MTGISELLEQFIYIANHPEEQKEKFLAEGKKIFAVLPYYVPDEIIAAAGAVPMGIWGCKGTPELAKEYFPSFFCTIAQMNVEMMLNGTLEGISGVVCPSLCDTLRPLQQDLQEASKWPVIYLSHPQARAKDYGVRFTKYQYTNMKNQVEEITGTRITDEALWEAIHVFNENRAACRKFVRLAGRHPEAVSAVARSAVLKSRFFMLRQEHSAMLKKLNDALDALPETEWEGTRVVLSGILADNPEFLKILDENRIAVAADDLAHESRSFRNDVAAGEGMDPLEALARQFGAANDDTILYDPKIMERPKHVLSLVKENGAQGVVLPMMTFCDPEEMEYPYLKKMLDEADVPLLQLGYDQTMSVFGQAATALETFAQILEQKKETAKP